MLRIIHVVLIGCLLLAGTASAEQMIKVGSGEARYLGFIKVYEAELYADRLEDRADILQPDVSKCLKLTYEVALKPEDFIKGASVVLSRQFPDEQLDSITPQIDALHSAYVGVEPGDFYELCYDAASARTSLSLNERELVSIQSEQFGNAYLGIWLSDNQPLSRALQQDLVGAGTP